VSEPRGCCRGSITIPPTTTTSLWLTSPKAQGRRLAPSPHSTLAPAVVILVFPHPLPTLSCVITLPAAAGDLGAQQVYALLSLPKRVVCDTLAAKKCASNDARERLTNGRANRKYLTEIIAQRERERERHQLYEGAKLLFNWSS
jgi:hypothetical protein